MTKALAFRYIKFVYVNVYMFMNTLKICRKKILPYFRGTEERKSALSETSRMCILA